MMGLLDKIQRSSISSVLTGGTTITTILPVTARRTTAFIALVLLSAFNFGLAVHPALHADDAVNCAGF
jgi:hypothetical protein